MSKFIIDTGDNHFNAGWVAYVLGLPREPDDLTDVEAFKDGWDMGAESGESLSAMRFIMEKQFELEHPQYRVTVAPTPPTTKQ